MLFKTKYTDKYNKRYILFYRYLHILLGGVLGLKKIPYKYKKILFFTILIYQFGQLFFNVRYFFISNKLVKENSIKHTLNKFFEYLFGYSIVCIISNIK